MKLDTISVQSTHTHPAYTNVNQMVRDYYAGKPVLVRGYGPLAGLPIDCYDEAALRRMGYKRIEFCLGPQTKEVKL